MRKSDRNPDGSEKATHCVLCERERKMSFHHLIPKKCHSNKWFKKRYTRDEMLMTGINVCRQCHNYIHTQFSEKEMGREFNTLEALQEDPGMQKFVQWVKKQK